MTTTTAPPGTEALELTGLVKRFRAEDGRRVRAVDGMDLRIGRGEVVALLGPNGAGKTTTLDVVLGLSEPDAGRARVLGRRPRQAVVEGRVSAVLQTGGLMRDLTIAETVRMIASLHHAPLAVDEVLERAGLTALAGRRVVRCSGGEQQRLKFALALLPDPELLVLDEPTTGLDVGARRAFWTAMRAEAAAGRTVLFATHHLEEADAFADRLVLMAAGRVVADGPTPEIRRSTLRTVGVTWDDPPADAVLARLPGVAAVSRRGARLVLRATEPDVLARHLLTRTPAHDLEIAPASLEDAFLRLTDALVPTEEHR
ncbi:ABC transporter ATP-binding protein [Desertihabitans brevis]|uniref:ABC transporter ATP-binding protein n=1 Tax=Desertihabitans brevis TaxID=2268447 RepID=A0A367YSZ8_9ACTN|nr:ABC transporter ATP-binding protein [Desertihabitans brevis]RCK68974.1 ABC transporter ATP-binding protein [Desertihabitans brevis]